jgi:hypothetical protein
MSTVWPIASAAVKPKIRSAAGLNERMVPSPEIVMIASAAVSTTARAGPPA